MLGGSIPLKLHIYTSDEELEYKRFDKLKKLYIYVYIKSLEKNGNELPLQEEQLQYLLNVQSIFKPVEFFDTNFVL